MHLSYTQLIKRPAIFQRLTGLSVKEFEKLLAPFSAQYEQLVIGPRLKAAGIGIKLSKDEFNLCTFCLLKCGSLAIVHSQKAEVP